MRFAVPHMLFGCAFALLVGLVMLIGGLRRGALARRIGDADRVRALFTSDPSTRRAWKAILVVLATALAFVAAARPQYGLGTRTVPATNVDIGICLDFSKSMYARDVQPSRIFQAKAEVARLVKELRGASFAAVAFAGEPIGLPLTPDGPAVSHFFRTLEPNDMPVGGTAIGRALDHARDLLRRAPNADKHKQVVVLVTDGEDLEGDPVSVARSLASDKITIHVVQIGGRTPEMIPEVNDKGDVVGYRRDRDGKPLTTSLTLEGERDLASIASVTGGTYIRAERGTTGIERVTALLRDQMTIELSEHVEQVHEDVYYYFLAAAIVLLVLETFLFSAPARRFVRASPPVFTPQQQVGLRQMLAMAPKPPTKQSPPDRPSEPYGSGGASPPAAGGAAPTPPWYPPAGPGPGGGSVG